MKKIFGKIFSILALTIGLSHPASAQTTAFTYQGKLVDDCCPATGLYDLRLRLWGSASGGPSVGGSPTLTLPAVPVTNGLFTASLDFGGTAFDGSRRWLEIEVRTNNNGSYVTLNPRTELTPTPYAMRASVATTVPDNAITRPKIPSGQVVKSVNGLTDSVSLVAGNNVTLATNGNNLTINSSGNGAFSLNVSSAYYNGGNVGIGTATPDSLLTVGSSSTRGTFHVYGGNDLPAISLTETRAGGHQYTFYSGYGSPGSFDIVDWTAPGHRLTIDAAGKVGIGTSTPSSALDVNGKVTASRGFAAPWGPILAVPGGPNTRLLSMRWDGIDNVDLEVPGATANNARFIFGANGNLSVGSLTIRGGADLAEPFQMSEEKIPEGSVVVIDEANPGHLKQAIRAYDTRVAGIVSGANGVKAGIALQQEGVLEGGQNVALTGRVYVKADASFGAIKPGDLLTTSDTPGHAMKVTDSTKAQGAILGKAMTALADGRGMVLVLVSLQ